MNINDEKVIPQNKPELSEKLNEWLQDNQDLLASDLMYWIVRYAYKSPSSFSDADDIYTPYDVYEAFEEFRNILKEQN